MSESRRQALKLTGGALCGIAAAPVLSLVPRDATAAWATLPIDVVPPAEDFNAAMKRLFGDRQIQYDKTKVSFTAPNVAENGAVVPVVIEAMFPTDANRYVKNIYFIVDKNKRPHSLTFSFTPDTGMGRASTNLRLGGTSWIYAVLEMNDKTLLGAKSEVKVVVGGCGG